MQDKQGQRVPKVTFRTRQNDEWKNITSDDVFAGRNVIVFSLPGSSYADLFIQPPASLQ